MKKLIIGIILAVVGLSSVTFAEEIRTGTYQYDLSTGSSMSAGSGTSALLVDGNASLDLFQTMPNLRIFALQVYEITGGALTASTTGASPFQQSGVTYTIDYSTSINAGTWSSGTTNIVSAIAISGQSTEVINFAPEFGRYYRFRVTAGITQFGTFKAKLLIE